MRKDPPALCCVPVILLLLNVSSISAQTQHDVADVAQSVVGKTICGYQGWFNCYGDGSPVARWFHWSNGVYQSNNGSPAPGAIKFEAYPAIDEYNSSSLFQTNLGNLGDGSPAKLFSSYKADVIDTHFKWMQQNGIDGVALQRFISETFDGVFKSNRDSIAARVMRSAEDHQRVFYLMYDISGLDAASFDAIKTDWQNNMVNTLHLTSSPYYVHQDNKPVVCLWGFGFTDRSGNASQCLDVINWFKSNGCFVIGGTPTNWRTSTGDSKPGFISVYSGYDMISPWSVGRFSDSTGADNFKNNYLMPDLAYCNTNGILYQPVVFPGFAWSNWNGGPQNEIPRNKGEFFWRQVYNIKQAGIGNMYVAMFDEYDEGTAIAKMADSYYAIPNNQYFLTTSSDGTYLSPGYLRLVGKATKAINGNEAITKYVSIPYSNGPIWFRSGFESKYDAVPSWTDSPDPSVVPANIIGYGGSGNLECGVISEINHIGTSALRYSGRDNSPVSSSIYFRTFNVNIPVNENTVLSFWTYPQTELSRYVSVDLIMSDGTTLRNCGATDTNEVSMHPNAGRGVMNTWQKTVSNIGLWLNGKTISRILVGYDHSPETGDFRGFIDDIAIYNGNEGILPITLYTFSASLNNSIPNLQWTTQNEINASKMIVERSYDGIVFNAIKTIPAKNLPGLNNYLYQDNDLPLNTTKVYYRIKFIDNNNSIRHSKIETLSLSSIITSVRLVPNPAKTYVELIVISKINEKATVKITDASGKTVFTTSILLTKGTNNITVNKLAKFAHGLYNVQVTSNSENISSTLLIN